MNRTKTWLAIALAATVSATSWGQVTQNYGAEVSQGTYSTLTDGNVVPLGVSGTDFDKVVYDKTNTPNTSAFTGEGYPIGFDFKFDNKLMNQFFIGSHGFLALGKDQVSTTMSSPIFFHTNADNDIIAFCYRSTVAAIPSTEISYKTEGSAPNRSLTVQFKDLQLLYSGWSGDAVRDTVQLQIRLHEDGKIEMITNGFEPSAEAAGIMDYNDGFRIGLRGQKNDWLVKTSSFNGNTFSVTSSSFITWSASNFPADGQTYTFTPPEDCEAPSVQPADLQLSSTSLSVAGTFKAIDEADHYLVLIDKNASLATQPENGKTYAKGDSIGTAHVINYIDGSKLNAGDEVSFETGDILDGAQSYHVSVLAANSACFFGPKYNGVSPLTASITTLPEAPVSLVVVDADSTSLTVNAAANTAGNDIVIAYTTECAKNNYGQPVAGGSFGTLTGDYAVGDSIIGGGRVAYVGKAKDGITINGLEAGTVYHLGVFSRNSAGQYSSTSVQQDTHTACIVPWTANFEKGVMFGSPAGWRYTESWQINRNYNLFGLLENANPSTGVDTYIETPSVYLAEGTNRVVFNLLMTEYVNHMNDVYTMRDRDTIRIQVAEDGSNTYTTIQEYTVANRLTFASTSSPVKLYVPFDACAGKKARIRFMMHVYGDPQTTISNFRIEKKGDCDYPINVVAIDSTIVSDEATITWTPQGEEDAWDIRYKKTADKEWSKIITVRQKNYTFTGLEGFTNYDVQVRARCSATSQSEWSETGTFVSGMAVPFRIAFSDLSAMPGEWQYMEGVLSDNTVLTEGAAWNFSKGWMGTSLSYSQLEDSANDWLITPCINLGDGSVNYTADITLTKTRNTSCTNGSIKVLVAPIDSVFTPANVLQTIKPDELPDAYDQKTYTVGLRGLKGKVRLALYVNSDNEVMPNLTLDSLTINYTCINDIEAKVDSVTEDSAHISWTSGADKWFYYVNELGQTHGQYQTTDKPELALKGLKPHTTYEIGLTKSCEEGDTAKVKVIELTTTGTICAQPENVKATADKWSARIEWTGEAQAYNVRYRKQNDTNTENVWITEQVRDTFIVIDNLESSTVYEYAVQSQCSKLDRDTSDYTPVATFTTLVETCLVPTNVTATLSYNKADIQFESEADKFEIAIRKSSDDNWTTNVYPSLADNDGKHIVTLTDLSAETAYKVRLRAICAEGDSSRWTAVTEFTTTAIPECVTPTNLIAEDITADGATLKWTADESNLSWNIRYRESSVAEWTEKSNIAETQYKLSDLKANTVYIWRVQAQCEADRQSNWASQKKFTTDQASGITTTSASNLSIFVKGHTLNIVNPENSLIRKVTVYTTDGRVLATAQVNTTENVFIPLQAHGQIVVRVEATGKIVTLHTNMK